MPVVKGVDITLTTEGRLLVSGAQSREFVERLASAFRAKNLVANESTGSVGEGFDNSR
jgi:hypothetical protein